MLNSEILDSIKRLIASILEEDNLHLVDISLCPQANRLILRLLIDKTYGGITLDECARLNEKISDIIERENVIKQSYILEVFSPGIDRPLINRDDFSRCLNRKVRIFFKESEGKTEEITGIITSVTDSAVNIDSEGKLVEMPFERISKAKQVVK